MSAGTALESRVRRAPRRTRRGRRALLIARWMHRSSSTRQLRGGTDMKRNDRLGDAYIIPRTRRKSCVMHAQYSLATYLSKSRRARCAQTSSSSSLSRTLISHMLAVCSEAIQAAYTIARPGGQHRVYALPFRRVPKTNIRCAGATHAQP